MLYLFLSVCCSLAIASIFKYNEAKNWDRVALLTANYWTATAVAAGVLWQTSPGMWRAAGAGSDFWMLVLVTGALFISTYFVLAWATNVAGMGLATGVMRVSVVLPVAASWMFWHEEPSTPQFVGLCLAGVAFFCIARRRKSSGTAAGHSSLHPAAIFFVLLLLFISGGVVDTCMKLFDEVFAESYSETFFLLFVYIVSAAIGTAITASKSLRRGQTPAPAVLGWGAALGLFNYGATLFFLRAVARLTAPFVFPANSVAIVLGAALIGVYGWGERLSRLNRVGLILAAAALVLLRM